MTLVVNNSTATVCSICLDEYKKNEVEDSEKTVELFCGHFFHLDCLKQLKWDEEKIDEGMEATSYEEAAKIFNANQKTCPFCREPFGWVISAQLGFDAREAFPAHLKSLEEQYAYDPEIMKAITVFKNLLSSSVDNHDKKIMNGTLLSDIWDGFPSVTDFPSLRAYKLPESLDVEKDMAEIMVNILISSHLLSPLHYVDEEAKRWKKILPSEGYSPIVKEKGVLVIIRDLGACRVSVRYLDRVVRQRASFLTGFFWSIFDTFSRPIIFRPFDIPK